MSMARLWRDQGKREEARELLAPVYGWLTEGFDTLDLKEAKALLDQLSSSARKLAHTRQQVAGERDVEPLEYECQSNNNQDA
jgi:uncharacterized protein YpbB